MGKIADAISRTEDEQTPLQVKLDELSKAMTILVIAISVVIFLTGFIKYGLGFLSNVSHVLDTFMITVSVAVAAIPEGLVAVVTIVLSMGVTKMNQRHAGGPGMAPGRQAGLTQVEWEGRGCRP